MKRENSSSNDSLIVDKALKEAAKHAKKLGI